MFPRTPFYQCYCMLGSLFTSLEETTFSTNPLVFKIRASSMQQNTKIKLLLEHGTSQCGTLNTLQKYTELIGVFLDKRNISVSIYYATGLLFSAPPLLCKHSTFFLHILQMIHKMILQTFKEILQGQQEDFGKRSKYTPTVNSSCL